VCNLRPGASPSVSHCQQKFNRSKYRRKSTHVGRRLLLAALAHSVLAVLHLEVISAHIHEKVAATPRRCTYLRRALARLQIDMFDSCSTISTHPLRDLDERGESMKPSRGVISAPRNNVLGARRRERERIPLTSHSCCCCCCCCCGLPACQHTGISTNISTKPVQSISTMSPTAAHVECTRRAGCKRGASKGQGYVRGGVCIVEEEKIISALSSQQNTPSTVALLLPAQPVSKVKSICR
jgi:hypothetical protein